MGKMYNGAERLELFGFEIIALIGNGTKEKIEKIENEMRNNNVVQYLYEKYKDQMFNVFDNASPYNIPDWENAFNAYSGYIEGNESRKFGITNEDDGLLLLAALTMDIISNRKG